MIFIFVKKCERISMAMIMGRRSRRTMIEVEVGVEVEVEVKVEVLLPRFFICG